MQTVKIKDRRGLLQRNYEVLSHDIDHIGAFVVIDLSSIDGVVMPYKTRSFKFATKTPEISTPVVTGTNSHDGTETPKNDAMGIDNAALLKQLNEVVSQFDAFVAFTVDHQSALINEIATLLDENWSLQQELVSGKIILEQDLARMTQLRDGWRVAANFNKSAYARTLALFRSICADLDKVRVRRDKWKQVAKNTVKEAEAREHDLITERDACHVIMNDVRNEADKVIPGASHGLTIDAARKMREEIEALRLQLAAANETISRLNGSEPEVTGKVAA